MAEQRRTERAAAVVDFVLVMVLLVPLVLGILQVGFVLHVRNTLAAAASDGARTAARLDAAPGDGTRRARALIRASLADRYAEHVRTRRALVGGLPGVVVDVRAQVPALGLFGPSITLHLSGHAVAEGVP